MDRQKEYKSENKMKDCLAYFHLSPVWEKVLKGFREKYISYGRFGGKVILKNLKPTDSLRIVAKHCERQRESGTGQMGQDAAAWSRNL